MRGFEIITGYEDKVKELPTRATEGSAGYDIRVLTENEQPVEIFPGESFVFETGIKAFMEKDEVLKLYVRSSIGMKKSLELANIVGIIDSDYYNNTKNEGHILISLRNTSNIKQTVEHNERVAQGIFVKFLTIDNDNAIGQRVGGVGSTNIAA